ncbi:MAG: hypothetical protein H6622_14060 [Halobacteriovoraceae bacterium]|nr:hypothetical protein [Halobacteriovoraceae bacterium]
MNRILGILSLILSINIYAGTPTLLNLTESDATKVLNDVNTSFVPTTVSGASSLGTIFGFQIGAVGGLSDAPNIKSLTSSAGGQKFDQLPILNALIQLHGPFGLGVDVNILPIDVGDFKYDYFNLGLKWTFTDVFTAIPFNIKLKLDFASGELQYTETESSLTSKVTLQSDIQQYSLVFSKKLIFIEPYFGLGYVNADSTIKYSGTASILSFATSYNKSDSDLNIFGGIELDLFVMRLGFEYGSVFGNSRLIGKLSFGF